jgi:hypothetical protein
MADQKTGVELIADERKRQIEVEKWDYKHDSVYDHEELAMAGAIYATPHVVRDYEPNGIPVLWPWDGKWWKPNPKDRIRELVKAGALIAAQIDLELSRKEEEML